MSQADEERKNDKRTSTWVKTGAAKADTGGSDWSKRAVNGHGVGGKVTECVSGRKCVESIGGDKQAHPHTRGRKGKALTSDSPGRPRPESDTFCHLKTKKRKETNDGIEKMSGRKTEEEEDQSKSCRYAVKSFE